VKPEISGSLFLLGELKHSPAQKKLSTRETLKLKRVGLINTQ
jgi:hypothetical protein